MILLIWGAGQHGRVVAELVEACGHRVAGFVDRMPRIAGVLTESAAAEQLREGRTPLGADGIIPAVGANDVRLALLERFRDRIAGAMVHPTAFIAPSATVGVGTVVLPRAVVQTGTRIGRGVILHPGAVVDHDAVIEDGVYLGPGAVVSSGAVVRRGQLLLAGAVVAKGAVVG